MVRDVRERRPHLLAVDEEVVALSSTRVRTPARSLPASGSEKPWHQISSAVRIFERYRCLLLVRPVRHDRRAGHPDPDHADVARRLGARDLLEEDRLVAVRRAAAAVLLRPRQPCVARLAELPAPLAIGLLEPAAAAPPGRLRDVLRDEVAHLLPEPCLVGRVAEIHREDLMRPAAEAEFVRANACAPTPRATAACTPHRPGSGAVPGGTTSSIASSRSSASRHVLRAELALELLHRPRADDRRGDAPDAAARTRARAGPARRPPRRPARRAASAASSLRWFPGSERSNRFGMPLRARRLRRLLRPCGSGRTASRRRAGST